MTPAPHVALAMLANPDPAARVAACGCFGTSGEALAALTALLRDGDREVSLGAACALGVRGHVQARAILKRALKERPSPRAIEAAAGVADEEILVFLARVGRSRPELAAAILTALDEIDLPRAAVVAAALRNAGAR